MRWLSLLAALLTMLASNALAATETGTAVGVNPDAAARGSGGERVLRVGSDIAVGETVVTDRRGQVQILFDDETRLVVGPGSSLRIEKYLLRGNQTAQKFAINALGGSFRFMTGRSPKAAYEIRTPTATIGVRGTAFDFTVDNMNLTTLVLFHGAVRLCTVGGGCTTLDTQCQVGAADLLQSVQLRPVTGLRSQFPYIRSQRPLLVDFRVAQAEACLRPSASGPAPTSLADSPGGGGSDNRSGIPAETTGITVPASTPKNTPTTPAGPPKVCTARC